MDLSVGVSVCVFVMNDCSSETRGKSHSGLIVLKTQLEAAVRVPKGVAMSVPSSANLFSHLCPSVWFELTVSLNVYANEVSKFIRT